MLTPYWFVFLRWLTGCSDQTSWTGILTGVVVYSVIAAGLGFVWSIAASQFRVAFAVPPLRRNGWLAVPALMFTITAAYLNIGIAQHPVGYTAPPDCDIYE
ncbi:MAG: hypothetical protein JHD16_16230 [Solirubrobacteraceae bacterium]|nr:hypothetical protein [Solirubrobacteraceae bacterium]